MPLLSWMLAAALAAAPRDLRVTVDDLPRIRIVRGLLRILARHGIHAVGFVKADAVVEAADREVLDLWLSAGHELGTHGYAHLDYATTDLSVYLADRERGRRSLEPTALGENEPAGIHGAGWRIVQDAWM